MKKLKADNFFSQIKEIKLSVLNSEENKSWKLKS